MIASECFDEAKSNAECVCLASPAQQFVLIVEDDVEVCRLIESYITKTGLYSVNVARNTEEAVALFKPGRYFALILDLHLGTSINEGITLATHLRDQDDNVFIAALSGYYPVFDERLLQCVDDFLKKPIDHDILIAKLLMWRIKHSRRMALKLYMEEKMMSYRKCLSEIREEEELLKEQLADLLDRIGFMADGGISDQ